MTGRRFRTLVCAVVAVPAIVLMGCSVAEKICGDDEYPVKLANSPTGEACVVEGDEPPDDYVRYPEGKVPETVGDKWDEYWDDKILDENGEIVED